VLAGAVSQELCVLELCTDPLTGSIDDLAELTTARGDEGCTDIGLIGGRAIRKQRDAD
jgi:hypothetical protein